VKLRVCNSINTLHRSLPGERSDPPVTPTVSAMPNVHIREFEELEKRRLIRQDGEVDLESGPFLRRNPNFLKLTFAGGQLSSGLELKKLDDADVMELVELRRKRSS
jgi:hypothetical protein